MKTQIISDSELVEHRSVLLRVLGRLTLYYVVLIVLVGLVNAVSPDLLKHLPIGGLDAISSYDGSSVSELEDALLSGDQEELVLMAGDAQSPAASSRPVWFLNAKSLLFAMLSAFILMLPVSWVYKSIHHRSIYDHSLDETTLILPAVVAGIVTVVQHSLALAFSLAGIVAGVQFRRALSDTFDTLFIFVAIGVGIAAGIGSIEIAIVLTAFFNYSTLGVCLFGDGLESQHHAQKKRLSQLRKLEKTDNETSSE